jgi:hypothetical protein
MEPAHAVGAVAKKAAIKTTDLRTLCVRIRKHQSAITTGNPHSATGNLGLGCYHVG